MRRAKSRNFMIMLVSILIGYQLWLFELVRPEIIVFILWQLQVFLNDRLNMKSIKILQDYVKLQHRLISSQDRFSENILSITGGINEMFEIVNGHKIYLPEINNSNRHDAISWELDMIKSFPIRESIYDPEEIEGLIDPTGYIFSPQSITSPKHENNKWCDNSKNNKKQTQGHDSFIQPMTSTHQHELPPTL